MFKKLKLQTNDNDSASVENVRRMDKECQMGSKVALSARSNVRNVSGLSSRTVTTSAGVFDCSSSRKKREAIAGSGLDILAMVANLSSNSTQVGASTRTMELPYNEKHSVKRFRECTGDTAEGVRLYKTKVDQAALQFDKSQQKICANPYKRAKKKTLHEDLSENDASAMRKHMPFPDSENSLNQSQSTELIQSSVYDVENSIMRFEGFCSTTQMLKSTNLKRQAEQVFIHEGKAIHIPSHSPRTNAGSNKVADDGSNVQNELLNKKASLRHCLLSNKLRRWCAYEWFYSSIDAPWFQRNEFMEYLDHAGLGNISALSRGEWVVVRSSLGKPRRFSNRFLEEERQSLEHYREMIRKNLVRSSCGTCNHLLHDLSCQFSEGQKVIVKHPKTLEICNGVVLKAEQASYRVKFDNHELGIETVQDIHCTSMALLENMPDIFSKVSRNTAEISSSIASEMRHVESYRSTSRRSNFLGKVRIEKDGTSACLKMPGSNQKSSMATTEEIDADNMALAFLKCALDKKEALVMELQYMNDQLNLSGDNLKNSSIFKRQYAFVLLQLKIANNQAISALNTLRERNACPSRVISQLQRSSSISLGTKISSSFKPRTPRTSDLNLMVRSAIAVAKRKAKILVDFPTQLKQSMVKPSDFEWTHGLSSLKREQISLAELTISCLAILYLVQTCSEKQLPISTVVTVLDDAVESLLPLSDCNFPIYEEIQQCMRIIKDQISVLIPVKLNI